MLGPGKCKNNSAIVQFVVRMLFSWLSHCHLAVPCWEGEKQILILSSYSYMATVLTVLLDERPSRFFLKSYTYMWLTWSACPLNCCLNLNGILSSYNWVNMYIYSGTRNSRFESWLWFEFGHLLVNQLLTWGLKNSAC